MSSFTKIGSAVAVALSAALALSACGGSGDGGDTKDPAGKDTYVLASVPSEDAAGLQSQFEKVIQVLEEETGKKWEFKEATDYAAVIEGQRAGQIDVASYGPFSYKIAKDSGVPIEPVGAMIDGPDEEPGYTSMLWAKKDSGIDKIEDLKGKKVCFVEPASTSGYLYPSSGLLEVGLDPQKDITPVMAGSHDGSLLTLNQGGCDAGFAFDSMMDQLNEAGSIKKDEYTMVWESPVIMGSPIAMNIETIDKETQEKVKTTLNEKINKTALVEAGVCPSEDDCKLPEDSWGFKEVTDKDYDGIRKVCEVTKAEACNAG